MERKKKIETHETFLVKCIFNVTLTIFGFYNNPKMPLKRLFANYVTKEGREGVGIEVMPRNKSCYTMVPTSNSVPLSGISGRVIIVYE